MEGCPRHVEWAVSENPAVVAHGRHVWHPARREAAHADVAGTRLTGHRIVRSRRQSEVRTCYPPH